MPEHLFLILAGWAAYAAVAAADLAFLSWKWRGADNGLNPVYVALLWPLVLPLLAAYYVGAVCYTCGIVLKARRLPGPPAGAGTHA